MSEPTAAVEQWTIGRLLTWTSGYFSRLGLDTPRLDAEVLLARVLRCSRIQLYTQFDENVSPADRALYRGQIERRVAGCPVAYLVGDREFFGLTFEVSPAVLIPRPETEHLVIAALQFGKREPVATFADLGIGSGAIAVTLLRQWPAARAWASDLSGGALELAASNARRHQVSDRLTLSLADLLAAARGDGTSPFDLIVSNPPYVSRSQWESLPRDVREHEPRLALDGGPDGLDVIRRIVRQAPDHLRDGGMLLVEFGAGREGPVKDLVDAESELVWVEAVRDASGRPRVAAASRRHRSKKDRDPAGADAEIRGADTEMTSR